MVWLMIPTEFNGSLILYGKIIRPYFLKHHGKVDDAINKVKNSGKSHSLIIFENFFIVYLLNLYIYSTFQPLNLWKGAKTNNLQINI